MLSKVTFLVSAIKHGKKSTVHTIRRQNYHFFLKQQHFFDKNSACVQISQGQPRKVNVRKKCTEPMHTLYKGSVHFWPAFCVNSAVELGSAACCLRDARILPALQLPFIHISLRYLRRSPNRGGESGGAPSSYRGEGSGGDALGLPCEMCPKKSEGFGLFVRRLRTLCPKASDGLSEGFGQNKPSWPCIMAHPPHKKGSSVFSVGRCARIRAPPDQ